MSGKNIGFGLGNLFKKEIEQPVANATAILEKYNNAVKAGKLDQEKFNNATANNNMTKYLQSLKGAKASQEGYNASLKATSIGSKAAAAGITFLNVALNSLVTMGVSLVIQGLVTWISKLATAQQDAIDTANEMAEAYKSTSNEILENIKSVESMQKEFERLSRGVDDYGNNIALSADEYARYKEIVEQIVGISPSLITGYDKEGNAIANKNGLIERSIELMKEEQRLRLEEITSDEALKKLASGKIGEYNKYQQDNPMNRKDNRLADGTVLEFGSLLQEIANNSTSQNGELELFKAFDLSEKWNDYIYANSNRMQNLVTDYYDEISDMVINKRSELSEVLSQDDLDALEKLILKHNQNTATYESQLEQYAQKLNPSLQLVPQTLTAYQEMTDAQKNFTSQYINGFRITADTTEDDVLRMSQSIKDFVDLLDNDDTAKQAINDFFALDKNMSASDWQSQANSLVDSIANALQLTDEEKLQLKVGLKIDDARYDELIAGVQEKLKDEFDGRVGELSFADLEIAYKLENTGEMTFDELIAKIAETANQTGVLSATLSSLLPEFQKLESSFSTLSSAHDELSNSGAITVSTLQSLMDNNLLQYLDTVDGKLQINTQRFLEDADATKTNALLKLQNAMQTDIMNYAIGKTEALSDTAKAAIANLGTNVETSGNQAAGASGQYIGFAAAVDAAIKASEGKGVNVNSKDISSGIQAIADSYKPWFSALEAVDVSLKTVSGTAKNTSNDIRQAMSSAQSAIQSLLTMTMNMIKQGYNDEKKEIQDALNSLSNRYNEEKKYLDDIAKKKQKQFDDSKKALQDELEGYRKKIDAQLELIRAKESERDYQTELSEKQEDVSDIEADLASISLDTSEEGTRRRLELEAQLAEKRKELEEFQHDKSIQDQEDALNKELSNFEDQINSKLDLLEIESQRYEEMHQKRMAEIDAEYEYERELLNQRQQDIEEQVSNESAIRAEAIQMIEDKNSGLYEKLLEWNRLYGDGLDSTVIIGWAKAQEAMDQFGGSQLGVLGVLNDLAFKMNDFESATKNAASAMQDLTNAMRENNNVKNAIPDDWRQQLANAGGLSGTQFGKSKSKGFKTGGKITKDRALGINIDGEPDAVLIKAHTNEVVLPKDNPKRALDLIAEFINSNKPLSNFANKQISNEISSFAPYQSSTMGIGMSNLQNYERISNVSGDTKIENVFHVQGNMDKSIIPTIEKMMEKKFHENARKQVNAITSYGGKLNSAKRGF